MRPGVTVAPGRIRQGGWDNRVLGPQGRCERDDCSRVFRLRGVGAISPGAARLQPVGESEPVSARTRKGVLALGGEQAGHLGDRRAKRWELAFSADAEHVLLVADEIAGAANEHGCLFGLNVKADASAFFLPGEVGADEPNATMRAEVELVDALLKAGPEVDVALDGAQQGKDSLPEGRQCRCEFEKCLFDWPLSSALRKSSGEPLKWGEDTVKDYRFDKRRFVFEVVVDARFRDTGRSGNFLRCQSGNSPLGDHRERCFDDRFANTLGRPSTFARRGRFGSHQCQSSSVSECSPEFNTYWVYAQ
jgi:hypothetical protein